MLALVVSLLVAAPPDAYAQLLSAHVKDGRVDYAAIDVAALDAHLDTISRTKPPEDRAARIGFYIDLYNASVIRAVLRAKQPSSVLDVKDFFEAKSVRLMGQSLSLDTLEKRVIFPFAKDRRLHFVLVCAARGCPALEPRPFAGLTAQELEQRIDAATRRYLASPAGARATDGKLAMSKIFDWYADDFDGPEGALKFILDHSPPAVKQRLGPNPKLTHLEYDWSLNGR